MSSVTAQADGMGLAHSSSRSAPVCTATTPGIVAAAAVSMLRIRAWAKGLRRTARCSTPGMGRSAVYFASPVSSGASSRRTMRLPTNGAAERASVAVMR